MKIYSYLLVIIGCIALFGVLIGYTHLLAIAAMAFTVALVVYPKGRKIYEYPKRKRTYKNTNRRI